MTNSWLKNLEENLERKLSEFIDDFPSQKILFERQSQADLYEKLLRKNINIIKSAEEKRQKLIALAEEIREWEHRLKKTTLAKQKDLNNKVRNHLESLNQNGKKLWDELVCLGIEWEQNQSELNKFAKDTHKNNSHSGLIDEWERLETEIELDVLRKKTGF